MPVLTKKGRAFCLRVLLVAFAVTRVVETLVYDEGLEKVDETMTIMGYDAGDGSISPVEESINFIGYLAPGESIPEWMKQKVSEYEERQ